MKNLYYYTTSDTMPHILQKKNIWATNINYMNDSMEYRNGFEEIKGILNDEKLMRKWINKSRKFQSAKYNQEELSKALEEADSSFRMEDLQKFTISFCETKDLLSQWIIYAKESGVCLGLQFDEQKEKTFFMCGRGSEVRNLREKQRPQKIFYYTADRFPSLEEKESVAFEILDYLFRDYQGNTEVGDYLKKQREDTSIFVKQYDFRAEREYRLAFGAERNPKIGYRLDRHILKPYLDIESKFGWPVASVMVGPGSNQEAVYNSIRFFLDHEKIESSLLHSVTQWRKRIKEYLFQSKKIKQLWNDWKENGNVKKNTNGKKQLYFMFFTKLSNIKGADLRNFDRMKSIFEGMQMLMEDYPDDYFQNHYFTKSGLILEKSIIPYIY